ncbi:MAG TPA: acylphosphatase [Anaerolineaceae bacterium]|nr:acylphosphatase [Anaerolineaceae bacterium]
MNAETDFQLHAVVEGHVQGVGFRYFVIDRAEELKLTGWVRNTREGNVEVCAQGSREQLDKLLEALHRGPRAAFVTVVHEEWLPASGEWRDFSMKPTV